MKSKDLLLRIIQEKPNLPTFHVAKLAYLFDLLCVRTLGEPKSGISFAWWQFGPYSADIESALWDLSEEGKIRIRSHTTRANHDCRLHEPIEEERPRFSPVEEDILSMIMRKYSGLSTEELKKIVYATPPMLDAQKRKAHMGPLNMTSQEGLPVAFKNRGVMQALVHSYNPKTKWIASEVVMEKLLSLPLPSRAAHRA